MLVMSMQKYRISPIEQSVMMVKFLLSGRYLNLNNSDHTYQLLTLIWFSFVRKDDQCVMLGLQTVWRLGAY
jgi:hypothetical protein